MAAVRALRKQPVLKGISLKTEVVSSANYQSFDVAPDKLICLTWADAVGQCGGASPLMGWFFCRQSGCFPEQGPQSSVVKNFRIEGSLDLASMDLAETRKRLAAADPPSG